MNPAFIYFREIPLKYKNKFTLDFSDEELVQKINFDKKKIIILQAQIVI